MQLPEELQQVLHQELSGHSHADLKSGAERLMARYKEGRSSGALFEDPPALHAYLAIRMPATYAAVSKMLQECRSLNPQSLLDLGAGPGTASWAAASELPTLTSCVLVEQNKKMAALGKRLSASSSHPALQRGEWLCQSVLEPPPSADLVVLSYLIGELSSSQTEQLLERIWKSESKTVAILEPGTPAGAQRILAARCWALSQEAALVAPCPHSEECPMRSPNWCHFPARVERTRLHKELKGGTLGYEDEKFSYIIFSKISSCIPEARIVGLPQKGSGFVKLPVCVKGVLQEKIVSRKQENYRLARDAEWGSRWM